MRRLVVVFLVLSQGLFAQTKDSMDIFQCFEATEKYYPKTVEKQLIEKETHLKIDNIQAEWYPQIFLNAQATYQSDVVEIDMENSLPFPVDFPAPSNDQYMATLDVNQKIYDGGIIKFSKNLEEISGKTSTQSVDVAIHQVKEQVSQVFFGVLLLQKKQAIVENTIQELMEKKKTIRAGVERGVLLSSDLKSVQAELLKLEQKRDELSRKIEAYIQILNELTGLDINSKHKLALPNIKLTDSLNLKRPEHKLFWLQIEQIEMNKSLVKSQKYPKVFAFGQVGYGRPGLNMLEDEFDNFYMMGIKFKWNIWDWKQNSRKRQILDVKKKSVEVERKTFDNKLTVNMKTILADIENYRDAIDRDERIISLRREVAKSAKSKLENGTITSSEYISELNQLKNAQIQHEKHLIELQKAKVNYLLTAGTDNLAKNNND